jgi:protein-S-isoprenylcysteine O-methyltransferase Ste14
MINILKKHNEMNIIGQGGKIILFTLPSLIAALLVHIYFPRLAGLPAGISLTKPVGYIFLLPGLALWVTAVTQLLVGFSKGKLVTTGAYGVVRNPIYSSAIFFLLPATALITQTWVYFVPAIFLYISVTIFIGEEEKQLSRAFGEQYEDYLASVHRLVPFKTLYSGTVNPYKNPSIFHGTLTTPSAPRILLLGYSGANNTGSEALLLADIEDVRAVLGPQAVITIPSLNPPNLRRYINESPVLRIVHLPTIYFSTIHRLVRENDLVMLVEGSTYYGYLVLCYAMDLPVGHALRAPHG